MIGLIAFVWFAIVGVFRADRSVCLLVFFGLVC